MKDHLLMLYSLLNSLDGLLCEVRVIGLGELGRGGVQSK